MEEVVEEQAKGYRDMDILGCGESVRKCLRDKELDYCFLLLISEKQ